MKVLMVGVDDKTKGGMWSVAKSYLQNDLYQERVNLRYVMTATIGPSAKKILFFAVGFLKILMLLVTQKWDIVHIHMAERGSVYRKLMIARLANAFQCKVVLHLHGAEFEPWYNGLSASRKKHVRRGLNSVDCVLLLGEYWRPFISSLVEQKQKIKVLYNAVPVPAMNRYQINAENLLFLGEVGVRKGVYDILDALGMIDEQLDDRCQLLIYGPNPDKDIAERIEKRKLQHRVRYMGWVDPSQFDQLFSGIAVNVLPSYHEGLPMTILETMAYGIPNISTDVAAIPEVVNQENGILIQPGDIKGLAEAILCLLQDQDIRKVKSENAYQMLKGVFSIERHMQDVINIYEDIMKWE